MTDKNIIISRAVAEIQNRRNIAKAENDVHFQEIDRKIPEISEINSQLALTGKSIISIIRKGENVSQQIESLKEKNLQAQNMIRMLLKQYGYPEDYLVIKYSCEKCEDTGYVNGQKCDCLIKLIASMTAKEMNKNSNMSLCSFETFDINLCQAINPFDNEKCRNTMTQIFNYCRNYAYNFSPEKSGNILMFGKTGLGKTHLSLSIANEVLNMGYNVLYDSTLNYLNQISKEYFHQKDGYNETLSQLLDADLLILDDLGSEFSSNTFYLSTIYNIINTRINKRLPTIISTNLNHEKMLEKYEERIISRLFAIYDSLEFVGKDVRLIKRKLGV